MYSKQQLQQISAVLKNERERANDASRLHAVNSVIVSLADALEGDSRETFRRSRFYKATGFVERK